MSTSPTPEPRAEEQSGPTPPSGPSGLPRPPRPNPALIFDDPLDQQSSDDTDRGWGDRPAGSGDSAADLARFLDEKPPHHI
nr:hypothetical protein OH820_13280 [Streptomyces sp. NBC_00857]